MSKNIILIAFFSAVIVLGVIEMNYVQSQFKFFEQQLEQASQQVIDEDSDTHHIDEIVQWWRQQKKTFHSFIPHNEIKDIDSLLMETRSFIISERFDLARARLEKLLSYAKNIPGTFSPHFENIF